MKTLTQSLFVTLLLSTTTFASPATTTPANSLKPVEVTVDAPSYKVAVFPSSTMAAKLNVIVEREAGQAMTILLKSTEGEIMATQQISKKQASFRFQFNMAALQDGNYVVEVVAGNDKTVHAVTLSSQPAQAATRTIALN